MTICFVFGCNHQGLQKSCKMFRFPPNQALARRWERLCRRKDRCVNPNMDRICSCHFKDGIKGNGPTQFPWSSGFDFPDPNKISRTVKSEEEYDSQKQCVNTDESSTSSDTCVPVLPPHVTDHPYQLSFQRLTEEHKNLKLQVKDLTRQIQAMSTKRAFTLEDIIGDERKCLKMKMDGLLDSSINIQTAGQSHRYTDCWTVSKIYFIYQGCGLWAARNQIMIEIIY